MTENSRIYENFLDYRRKGNNLAWVSRELNHQLAFKQKKLTTAEYHKQAVLKSPKIQELLDKVSPFFQNVLNVLTISLINITSSGCGCFLMLSSMFF